MPQDCGQVGGGRGRSIPVSSAVSLLDSVRDRCAQRAEGGSNDGGTGPEEKGGKQVQVQVGARGGNKVS